MSWRYTPMDAISTDLSSLCLQHFHDHPSLISKLAWFEKNPNHVLTSQCCIQNMPFWKQGPPSQENFLLLRRVAAGEKDAAQGFPVTVTPMKLSPSYSCTEEKLTWETSNFQSMYNSYWKENKQKTKITLPKQHINYSKTEMRPYIHFLTWPSISWFKKQTNDRSTFKTAFLSLDIYAHQLQERCSEGIV